MRALLARVERFEAHSRAPRLELTDRSAWAVRTRIA
jgi:hypothetical protein